MRILLMILCMVAALSCRTKRTVVQQTEKYADTFSRVQTTVRTSDSGHFTRVIRDTVLSIPQRTITDTASLAAPTIIKGKGVHVKLTPLPGNKVAVEGNCDSLNVFLMGQIQETMYWRQKAAIADSAYESQSEQLRRTDTVNTVKNSSSAMGFVLFGVICFAGGIYVGAKLL